MDGMDFSFVFVMVVVEENHQVAKRASYCDIIYGRSVIWKLLPYDL